MARKRSAEHASAAKTAEPNGVPLEAAARAVTPGRESLLGFADQLERMSGEAAVAAPEVELHLVTFRLDAEEFGVPIFSVREIIRVGDITRVPQSPAHIRGVTNLRGRILPVVEIRTRLGLSPAVESPRSRIVVVEAHGRVLGLLVDAVSHVLKVPESSVLPPPEEVITVRTDYITGVARVVNRLIILVDLDKALLLDPGTEH